MNDFPAIQGVEASEWFDDPRRALDRLHPDNLRSSAEFLLKHNEDHVTLVASLLRDIRRDDEQRQAIREGYEFSHRRQQDDLDRLQGEVNDYREALRLVKRATRNVKVGPA